MHDHEPDPITNPRQRKRQVVPRSLLLTAISAATVLAPAASHADDWPGWFGPQRDGVWREDGIVETFPEGGPAVAWRTPCGNGYAGPAVAGGRVFVMDRRAGDSLTPGGFIPGDERVFCLDEESGELLWEQKYDCPYSVSYAAGPRTTPVVDGDLVFTLGAEGNLHCWKAADGEPVWDHDFKTLLGVQAPTWGFAATPLVEGDLLICLARGDGSTAVAFDKRTGEERWRALSAKEPGYCPPVIIENGGRRLVLVWHPESVNALDPATGEPVWTLPWQLRSGLSVPTPRAVGDLLFFTCFYNGSMLLRQNPDNTTPETVWKTERESERRTVHLNSIIATPVIADGHIYGTCSYGEFRCLELATGDRVWESLEPLRLEKPARWGTAFITPHRDRYFIFTEGGDLAIARLTPEGYDEIDRAHVIEPDGIDMRQRPVVWSAPAYANRHCVLRNDSEVVRLSLAAGGE